MKITKNVKIKLFINCICIFIIFFYINPKFGENIKSNGSQLNLITNQPLEIKKCRAIYGRITILVIYDESAMNRGLYQVANSSLHCYLKSQNYNLVYVNVETDERSLQACGKYKTAFWFRKHCVVAEYLKDTDWMLVLDADTGVVNPHHCIEDWIDPRVDIIFYERLMHWEIACGNYLIKNTAFSRKFLLDWADWEFNPLTTIYNSVDNGALQHHILKTVIPDAKQEYENCMLLWNLSSSYETYLKFVICIKESLGANRVWPGKMRIFRRAHFLVRDGYVTNNDWTAKDFMIHGWKAKKVNSTIEILKKITNYPELYNQIGSTSTAPFLNMPDVSKCDSTDTEWRKFWKRDKIKSEGEIREYLAAYEKFAATKMPERVILHLDLPDVGLCYPNCENETNI